MSSVINQPSLKFWKQIHSSIILHSIITCKFFILSITAYPVLNRFVASDSVYDINCMGMSAPILCVCRLHIAGLCVMYV